MSRARRNPLALVGLLSAVLAGCGGASALGTGGPGGGLSAYDVSASAGNVSVFVEPQAGVAPLVQAIEGARQSVEVEVYMLTNPDIENALAAAAKRVTVQVMLDPTPYNPSNPAKPLTLNRVAFNALKAAGAQVEWSSPAFTYTHAKFMVVDGRTAYINTLNFTKSGVMSNREFGAIDSQPQDVQDLANIFAADWARTSYTSTAPDLVVSPDNSRSKLEALLSGASQSIAIEDEEFSDPEAIALLGQKAKSGVNVEVLLASPTHISENAASAQQLEAVGVTVRYLSTPNIHAKLILTDGQSAYIGSVNLSTNSMENNREVGLLMTQRPLLATLNATFAGDWSQSQAFPASTAALPLPAPGNQLAI